MTMSPDTTHTSAGEPYQMAFEERLGLLAERPLLDITVADHCNLRCRGCIHFAPLAEPHFLDLGECRRDLDALSRIPGIEGYFKTISLMGGEPLLHPHVADVVRLVRECLPGATIALVSNGILLPRMGEEFWQALVEADALLVISPYPLNIDYAAIAEAARARGVRALLTADVTGTDRGKEVFFRPAFDATGSQDPAFAFNRCPFGGHFMQLRHGSLWPCQLSAYHDLLDQAFGTELSDGPLDRLPLAEVTSTEQIERFRRSSHPMCRFCANDRLSIVDWRTSRRERDEWLAEG